MSRPSGSKVCPPFPSSCRKFVSRRGVESNRGALSRAETGCRVGYRGIGRGRKEKGALCACVRLIPRMEGRTGSWCRVYSIASSELGRVVGRLLNDVDDVTCLKGKLGQTGREKETRSRGAIIGLAATHLRSPTDPGGMNSGLPTGSRRSTTFPRGNSTEAELRSL